MSLNLPPADAGGRGRAAPLVRLLAHLVAPFLRLPGAVQLAVVLVAIVAAGAAVISWDAGRWAAGEIGIAPELTWLFPIVVDGMIAGATVAVLVVAAGPWRVYVWVLLLSGLAVSIFANGAHSPEGGPVIYGALTLHRAGSAVPALALGATLHLLAIIARATMRAEGAPRAAPQRAKREARRARPARAPAARVAAIVAAAPGATGKELARKLGVSEGHARKLRARLQEGAA